MAIRQFKADNVSYMKSKVAKISLITVAVAGFLGLSFGSAKPVYVPSYRAVRVIDGDTFETAEKQWIRVSGIDAPEQGMCGSREAKQELEKLVLGKDIYLKVMYHDSTRLMALVYSKDGLIATKMLASGWAELNDRDGLGLPELSQAVKAAREQKIGLFSQKCTQTVNPDKPDCKIKANKTTNNPPTYHFPGCNSYNVVLVELHHGDDWFCTEKEAQAAGFKRAATCPSAYEETPRR